ncbi:MAG: OmpA family protein, partial [Deltaproteobacteria bacterium]
TEDLDLVPWQWKIPHEEDVSDTGSWEIKQSELPKLERSWKLLQKGLRKYGRLLDAKLYIAGFTDTVASADYNRRLSENRARAIAQFFRKKGFRHPIYYQGFGERGLKVPTPDETDEPRNRRAEYVLAAEPPPLDVSGAELHWKRLQ